jgi:hypothetical protein
MIDRFHVSLPVNTWSALGARNLVFLRTPHHEIRLNVTPKTQAMSSGKLLEKLHYSNRMLYWL